MKKIVFAGSFLLLFSVANAQQVSLYKAELKQLKSIIKQDSVAHALFLNSKSRADKAILLKPQPVEVIASQGLLMGDPKKMATLKALQDVDYIFALALTYKLAGGKSYLNKASEFLTAWATVNKPNGDPINETKLEDLVFAYDLIKEDLPKKDKALINDWLRRMINAELTHVSATPGRSTATNNWNSHRIKMMTMIAFVLDDQKLEKLAEEAFLKQLDINLKEDGSTYDFYERDALHYHIYSVEPLLKTAIVFNRATGKNYFDYLSENNASIKKSTDFLVPFMTKEKPHKEFENSRVAFDRKRAANNEKGFMIADFIPSKGFVALLPALYFDESYLSVINKVADGKTYSDWQILFNKVRRKRN